MLRPIRRHTRNCGNYGKWDVDCPSKTKLKCPLIVVRYEMGPSGRKIREEQALKTNDEAVAWQLINQMVVSGEIRQPQRVNPVSNFKLKREVGKGASSRTPEHAQEADPTMTRVTVPSVKRASVQTPKLLRFWPERYR